MFKRILDLQSVANKKSLFLLGPRQTGKSTLLHSLWPMDPKTGPLLLDLLHTGTFRRLSADPSRLEDEVSAYLKETQLETPMVIIDEIQMLPSLLNEVHRLMELHKKIRFILTGSSARKLKRSGTNLLAGRAWLTHLHPLCFPEWNSDPECPITLEKVCTIGSLPHVLQSQDPQEELKNYVGLYLQEEIRAEGLSRSIENFSRFLEVAALSNTEQVLLSAVASDAELPARTVRDYFQILEDTLVGTLVPAYRGTLKRKAVAAAKFYFFDIGVANALLGRTEIAVGTPEFGKSLEHLIFCELTAAIHYFRVDIKLYYWRSTSQLEVDFLMEIKKGKFLAIEVKGKKSIQSRDLKGLRALGEDIHGLEKIVVCLESVPRISPHGISLLPAEEFLTRLWRRDWF